MSGTPGDGIDDAELLARSDTDPASFGIFYRRHVDTVLGYHFRRTGCAQTAADLTAETFAAEERGLEHSTLVGYREVYDMWLRDHIGHHRAERLSPAAYFARSNARLVRRG